MTCKLFHDWGKWVDSERRVETRDYLANTKLFVEYIQSKTCTRCGKKKVRRL